MDRVEMAITELSGQIGITLKPGKTLLLADIQERAQRNVKIVTSSGPYKLHHQNPHVQTRALEQDGNVVGYLSVEHDGDHIASMSYRGTAGTRDSRGRETMFLGARRIDTAEGKKLRRTDLNPYTFASLSPVSDRRDPNYAHKGDFSPAEEHVCVASRGERFELRSGSGSMTTKGEESS